MIPVEMINPATGALALEIMSMSKRFGDVIALNDVSLNIPAGGFHALLGENGAGKSTLVKCLVGFYSADQGTVLVDDREVLIANPKDASQLGIGMVYQHFTLVQSMTVAENLVVARGALPAFINWQEERARLADFMTTLPFKIPLDKPAGALAAGENQGRQKQLPLARSITLRYSVPSRDAAESEFAEWLKTAIEPWNQVGLFDDSCNNLYSRTAAPADAW